MPKFNANLSMMFNEVDFLDRFARRGQGRLQGRRVPVSLRLRQEPARRDRRARTSLQVVLFNMPPGRLECRRPRPRLRSRPRRASSRRAWARPSTTRWRWAASRSTAWPGSSRAASTKRRCARPTSPTCSFAGKELAKHGIKLLIEAINTRDIPGFYLNTSRQAFDIMHYAQVPNLSFQYDIYHMQIMEGDLAPTIEKNLAQDRATCSSPTRPAATSPAPARSTTRSCSSTSTRSATRAGSAASIGPPPPPRPGSGWVKPYL